MNEAVKKCRIMLDPIVVAKNWARTDPAIIESKYRYKKMMKDLNIPFKPVDKNKIMWYKKGNLVMDNSFVLTEKYNNFNGRIITNESRLYNQTLQEYICVEWDCGATYSSISTELVQKLNLKSCGVKKVASSINSELSDIYDITLILHDDLGIPLKVAAVSNIHNWGIDMLIGMDVISLGDFAISTYNNVTCFSFRYPSQGFIDFNKQ